MKLVSLIVISTLILPVAADESPQPNCECSCPTLRQHAWSTLKQAWHSSTRISSEQWQAFLRWRQLQKENRQTMPDKPSDSGE